MAFRTLYKTLLEVELLHAYFLDDGDITFIAMDDDDKKKQLEQYDFATYLDVVPSYATTIKLRNHKLVLRYGQKGFTVLGSVIEEDDKFRSKVVLEEDLKLTFLIYKKDYLFDNYTELTGEKNRIFYFSNIKPVTESNPYAYIPLSTTNGLVNEDFLLTEESAQLIWYAIEQEDRDIDTSIRLNAIADIDLDDFNTDEGKLIVNQSIQKQQGKGLLGIIQLQPIGDNNIDIIELDNTNPDDIKSYTLDPSPQYRLHFDNRKTIWRYIKKSDSNELETTSEKPLTKKGFVEIDPDVDLVGPLPSDIDKYLFPNPTPSSIKRETVGNTITTYSEIYI